MISRRSFLIATGACACSGAWPIAARAQKAAMRRIGFLGNSTAALEANLVDPFREGLRNLGYEEGKNIVIEYRWAEGDYERFPALIAELTAQDVELIVTAGTPAALAVHKAAEAVPLVMVAVGDPVGTGLVESLGRPGGNVTGLTSIAPELEHKRLELLKEVIPGISSVAVMWNPTSPFQVISEKQVRAAAEVLGMSVFSIEVKAPEELEGAFASIISERPDALDVLADRLFLHNRARIMAFAVQDRLPGVYAYRELVDAGGLMSYGPSYADMHRRAATYVHNILQGANPADLPVERPVRFELVVNLRAASALGVDLPPTLLARADELLE